jgi:hypothetical protein
MFEDIAKGRKIMHAANPLITWLLYKYISSNFAKLIKKNHKGKLNSTITKKYLMEKENMRITKN